MCQEGVKFDGAEFFTGGIWNVFVCGATTIDPMDKRRPGLDSARQIGLETTLMDLLMIGWSGTTEGKTLAGGILKIEILELYLHAEPQPEMVWQNGGNHWIQHVK